MCQNIAVIQSGDDSMQHLFYITIIAKHVSKYEKVFLEFLKTQKRSPQKHKK